MLAIEVANLRTRAGSTVTSFTVERGEIFGISGPSGAGKSATVECLAGLRRPGHGTVRVLGLDARHDGAELRRRVGIQLQHAELPGKLRVWEALDLYSSFYRQPADWRELLDAFGLSAWHDTPFAALTTVAKRWLAVALALAGDPEIAIFDELTAGLGPEDRHDTWSLVERVRNRGVTVVLVTRCSVEAEVVCDRVIAT
ncbi:ATP-binding cassette domain-containing protein [Phytohabitans aurantiacus]|jgi:ABC-2 type transport system ATP-binding protein|uniref:ABC transporter ATP-binding protein n=1 Tax=Phytohabitans aurantiacus TaxID=3016789 RepID=A0ABQ5QLR1_9ACTN|nr:ABC transporter ATP-binding protein [Phytohabitans aurantiacus]GLH95650.1 ABC transporter ATP-binding protein [Phytohabitans aurantiacus]